MRGPLFRHLSRYRGYRVFSVIQGTLTREHHLENWPFWAFGVSGFNKLRVSGSGFFGGWKVEEGRSDGFGVLFRVQKRCKATCSANPP